MSNKTERVRARVTPEQYEQIMQKVEESGLSKSDYIRKALLDKEITRIDNLKDIYIELKKQGNNLNQIARAINQGEIKKTPGFGELKAQYQELIHELREIIEVI